MKNIIEYKGKNEAGHSLNAGYQVPCFNLMEASRFTYFNRVFDQISHLEGDIVECGVGWGWSLLYLSLITRLENKGRHIWGFDSFEGFPEPTKEDNSPRNPQKGEWKTDLLTVYKLLETTGLDPLFLRNQITLVKGFFDESLTNYTGQGIALLHADADLFESYKSIYDHLFGKVIPFGIIMFDEYMNTFEHQKWPGAKKAIDSFFLESCELKRDKHSGKYYAIKKG